MCSPPTPEKKTHTNKSNTRGINPCENWDNHLPASAGFCPSTAGYTVAVVDILFIDILVNACLNFHPPWTICHELRSNTQCSLKKSLFQMCELYFSVEHCLAVSSFEGAPFLGWLKGTQKRSHPFWCLSPCVKTNPLPVPRFQIAVGGKANTVAPGFSQETRPAGAKVYGAPRYDAARAPSGRSSRDSGTGQHCWEDL